MMMRLSKNLIALTLLATLGACGDLSGPFGRAADSLRITLEQRNAPDVVVDPITRAQITANPNASLRVTDRLGRNAVLQAVTELDGQVTYRSTDSVSIAFAGPELLRSRGLTDDISGQISEPALPLNIALALPVGASAVGTTHTRTIRRIGPLAEVEVSTFVCTFSNAGPDPQQIVELTFNTIRIEEPCADISTDKPEAFVNTWWIDPTTGQVWRSRQWISGGQGYLDIEVLKSFG